jgi:hypothetical protein
MMTGIGCVKEGNIVQHRDSTPVFAGRDCVKHKILGSQSLGFNSNRALPKYKTETLSLTTTCSALRTSGLFLVWLRIVQEETYSGFNPGLDDVS